MNIENRILPFGPNYLGNIVRNSETFITIHETSEGTDFAPENRTIEYYEDRLKNPPKGLEQIGYHFLVSDKRVVQFIPLNFRTAHAGSTEGNNSLAIERLVNKNIDFPKAIANQAKLTATLMHKYGIPITHVVPHTYWNPRKSCPARLLAGMFGGWDGFISQVETFSRNQDFFFDIL